jgi:serine/threonine-protein kinase
MQATQQRILCPICRAPNRGDARFCQHCGNDVFLDGIYRITKVIKEGGMGMVYKAIDSVGVEYAVKEMHDRFSSSAERDEGIARFVEEAELLHNLNHPAVPKVYRSFIDEGRYYLAMEFIYGEDLEEVLKREHHFPEETVLRWADQLCDVLESIAI